MQPTASVIRHMPSRTRSVINSQSSINANRAKPNHRPNTPPRSDMYWIVCTQYSIINKTIVGRKIRVIQSDDYLIIQTKTAIFYRGHRSTGTFRLFTAIITVTENYQAVCFNSFTFVQSATCTFSAGILLGDFLAFLFA